MNIQIPPFSEVSLNYLKSLDKEKLISVGAVAFGGISITTLLYLLVQKKETKKSIIAPVECKRCKAEEAENELYKSRYQPGGSLAACVDHYGSCHCRNVRFKIRAPRTLNAVDIPSKIRFPRVTIPCADFDLLCDDRAISTYTVRYGEGMLGIHSFCSYCGVQIVYSPTVEPIEVQVNVDCLAAAHIDRVHITHHATGETSRLPQNHELAHMFNRRGLGADQFDSFPPLSSSHLAAQQQHMFPNAACGGKAESREYGRVETQVQDALLDGDDYDSVFKATYFGSSEDLRPSPVQLSSVSGGSSSDRDLHTHNMRQQQRNTQDARQSLHSHGVSPLHGTADHMQSAYPSSGRVSYSMQRSSAAASAAEGVNAVKSSTPVRKYSDLSSYSEQCALMAQADNSSSNRNSQQQHQGYEVESHQYTLRYSHAHNQHQAGGGGGRHAASEDSDLYATDHDTRSSGSRSALSLPQVRVSEDFDAVMTPLSQCQQMKRHLHRHMQ